MFGTLWMALIHTAFAVGGLRTDGVQPGSNHGEGEFVGFYRTDVGGDTHSVLEGFQGGVGLNDRLELMGLVATEPEGRFLGQARLLTPLIGPSDQPFLSFFGGMDYGVNVQGPQDAQDWWVEAGLEAGVNLVETLRIYGGVGAAWAPVLDADWFALEPSFGLTWRPWLSDRLTAIIGLEFVDHTDFDNGELGPTLVLGLGGRAHP